jgi:hypothetical protein
MTDRGTRGISRTVDVRRRSEFVEGKNSGSNTLTYTELPVECNSSYQDDLVFKLLCQASLSGIVEPIMMDFPCRDQR